MSQRRNTPPFGTASGAKAAVATGLALREGLRRQIGKQALPMVIAAALVLVMWDRIATLDIAYVRASLATVGPGQWLAGLAFTGLSFWALGRYDGVVHRLVGLDTPLPEARRTGMTAIAVAQTVGLGAVTGAFVRWRMLPSLSLADATRISVIVALSFLIGWAVIASCAALLVPLPLPGGRMFAAAILFAALALGALSLLRPGPLKGWPIPSIRAMGAILTFTAIDTLAAAMVLYSLLPPDLTIGAPQLVAAFLLALGTGLILATPGGVGPFEMALIALLPGQPAEPLLAAVLAYRALYYALPALIGALLLIRGPRAQVHSDRDVPALSPPLDGPQQSLLIDTVIDAAPRAEAGLLRHGRLGVLRDANSRPAAMAALSGQTLIAVADPLRRQPDLDQHIVTLTRAARARLRTPVLYKIGARLGAVARRAGWQVIPIASEGWIRPTDFDPQSPACRQLRRKLRKAEKAGVTISTYGPDTPRPLPLYEMATVAADWRRARGGERGFSMGTWRPETLPWAQCYIARDSAEGPVIAFITVHANSGEHTLDLMRARQDVPDGTMHLLVAEAIAEARRAGVARFSLAAVPNPQAEANAPLRRWLSTWVQIRIGATGLRQFKAAFNPTWETLYMAAPTRLGLAAAMLDLVREITWSPPPD